MTEASEHHDAAESRERGEIRYPAERVLAVLDTRDDVTATVSALRAGGFSESDIDFATGAERADELDASTGRRGFVGLVVRLAEGLGLADEEMETKDRYEQAMRQNRYVLAVATPTEEQKDRATRILRQHRAHTVTYYGKHTLEHIVPPTE